MHTWQVDFMREEKLMFTKRSLSVWTGMFLIVLLLCLPFFVWAQTEDEIPPANDEQDTFGGAAPDALILLDLSGSMDWNPAGDDTFVYGSSTACTADTTNCADYSSSGHTYCTGGFCKSNSIHSTCKVDCRRVAIAKRALFNVMDFNNDGKVDKNDASGLNVRIGYMRFKGGNDTGGDPATGKNKLVTYISDYGKLTGTSYQLTYCGKTGENSSCLITDTCATGECIAKASADGGTPLSAALKEAKKYLDLHKNGTPPNYTNADPGKACRQKFVILVSDGADTYACDGSGAECQAHMYERRREVVAAAKALNDHGYKLFVVGFGSTMPSYLKNTLNWMSYYGGTDNPDAAAENTGNPSAYSIPKGTNCGTASAANCCTFSTTAGTCPFPAATAAACFPSGVTASCMEQSSDLAAADCQGSSTANFKSTVNDPGYLDLAGYAFIAEDGDKLTKSLKVALNAISGASYSFTTASIQAIRTADENFIYEASFETADCPLWRGHLKRYNINATTGAIITPSTWDAAAVLNSQTETGRVIKTLIGNTLVDFKTTTSELTAANLNAADATERSNIITFFRQGDQIAASPAAYWRLGDIFHSSPMSIGTPNALFYDQWDKASPKAFETFRSSHIRTSANDAYHNRFMLVGANDGQLHAFKTGELGADGGGKELWSFIPPNQLRRLKLIYHTYGQHPLDKSRQYYVDGPTSAAEVWVRSGSPTDINNTTKTVSEWKTLLVTALGRGGTSTLWSSSTSCDADTSAGFSPYWTSTHSNYCGYYAFDASDTADDTVDWPFLWRIGANAGLPEDEGKYLGQAWSKMFLGRVRINNIERWVGIIGGGYSGCGLAKGGTCALDGGNDTRGKGFYVIDLSNGDILWKYTYATSSGVMKGDVPAGPAAVDSDNDGFIDRVYVGDLAGNIWRFQFCRKSDSTSCTESNWSGGMLFNNQDNAGNRPIYTSAAVSMDPSYNLWVYVGTGDKTQPTAPNAQERFYAIKDRRNNSDSPYTVSDLDKITPTQAADVYEDGNSSSQNGWWIEFPKSEKVLAEPTIYQGRLYFTSYIPDTGAGGDPCNAPGSSRVYNMNYITAKGYWGSDAKYISVPGSGVMSAVVVSVGPDGSANLYYSQSVGDHVQQLQDPNLSNDPRGSLIYWQDRRIRP